MPGFQMPDFRARFDALRTGVAALLSRWVVAMETPCVRDESRDGGVCAGIAASWAFMRVEDCRESDRRP